MVKTLILVLVVALSLPSHVTVTDLADSSSTDMFNDSVQLDPCQVNVIAISH